LVTFLKFLNPPTIPKASRAKPVQSVGFGKDSPRFEFTGPMDVKFLFQISTMVLLPTSSCREVQSTYQENIQLNFGQLWQLCKVVKLPELPEFDNFGK